MLFAANTKGLRASLTDELSHTMNREVKQLRLPSTIRVIFGLFLTLFATIIASCDQSSSLEPPSQGQSPVSQRVVVLSPAAAIIVRDLGYEKQVVGRHSYDAVLSKDLPSCGDQAGINYEALIRLEPTLVITQWGARALPEKLTTLAKERQWTLLDVNPLTLEQIADATTKIGAALSSEPMTNSLASTLAEQVRACGVAKSISPAANGSLTDHHPIKVLMLVGVSPITALGPGSCHHEMLIGAGGEPSLKEGIAFQSLTSEDLIRLAPDAIILFDPKLASDLSSDSTPPRQADVWKPIRDLNLEAVANDRLVVIDDPLCLMPSTAMIKVSRDMKSAIERWNEGFAERK